MFEQTQEPFDISFIYIVAVPSIHFLYIEQCITFSYVIYSLYFQLTNKSLLGNGENRWCDKSLSSGCYEDGLFVSSGDVSVANWFFSLLGYDKITFDRSLCR